MNKQEWAMLSANKVIFLIALMFAMCLNLLEVISVIGSIGTLIALFFGIRLACLQFEWQWFELLNRSNRVLYAAREFLSDAERNQGNKEAWNRSYIKFRTEYFDNFGLLKEVRIIKDEKYLKDLLQVATDLHTAIENAGDIFQPYPLSSGLSVYQLREQYDFNVKMKRLNPTYQERDIAAYEQYLMNHDERELGDLIQNWRQQAIQLHHLVWYGKDAENRFELYQKDYWSRWQTWHCLTWNLFKKKEQ